MLLLPTAVVEHFLRESYNVFCDMTIKWIPWTLPAFVSPSDVTRLQGRTVRGSAPRFAPYGRMSFPVQMPTPKNTHASKSGTKKCACLATPR